MIRFTFTILIFLLTIQSIVAQHLDIRFRHITIEDGLSSNTVWSVVQDRDGFMWFATDDGLNKYDGYNFTIYRSKKGNTLSLLSNRIIDILADEQGNLWIGTSHGLNYFLREESHFLQIEPPLKEAHYVRCLANFGSEQLLLGTSEGLYQVDQREKAYQIKGLYPENSYLFLDKNITNISEDSAGIIWISTTEGLYILENGAISKASTKGSHPLFSSTEAFRDVMQDDSGNYWIATESTDEGVFQFDSEMNLLRSFSKSETDKRTLIGNMVRTIEQLSDDKIWVGTYDGLSIYNPNENSFDNYQSNRFDLNSLSYNSVRDIYEDRSGGVWVATFSGGVNYFHRGFQKFLHVKAEPGIENSLSNNQVWTFAQEREGNIWVGTDQGLNYLNLETNTFNRNYGEDLSSGLLDKTIKALVVDRHNKLWIGSFLGLSVYDFSSQEFQHFTHNPSDAGAIGYGHVQAICEDAHGQIWIGTNGGGLNKYDSGTGRFHRFTNIDNETDGMIDLHINSIIDYDDGYLWVGTEAGLELFDKNKEIFTRSDIREDGVFEIFSALNILSQHLDDDGYLWIGTHGEGLFIYNTHSGDVFQIKDLNGLPGNTINSILQDGAGSVWVSTNHGISKLAIPSNGWNAINETSITNFNTTDGLQGSQYYPRSALLARDGQMYFGGTNGFNSFYPEKVKQTIAHPEVVFTDIRFRNSSAEKKTESGIDASHPMNDTITIKYQSSDFSIEFAGLNYFAPNQIIYAYKLEPSDKDWNVIGKERIVNYSKLPPGDYIFKVRATNNILKWGESFSQLKIKILPPFWRTWWAYLLYLLILAAMLYLFFRYSMKWGKLKSDLAWEHLEREKENELHQMRIKFFTDISHELRTPLTLILAPLNSLVSQFEGSNRLKNQLLMIQRNSERMLQLINQLLDLRKLETGHLSLKAGKGNIVTFVKEVSLAFREVATLKNIRYDFHTSQETINVWFDRDKFEIILYNLLSNAMKYTPKGGCVGLSIFLHTQAKSEGPGRFDHGYVEIIVEDNGRGIPSANLDKIFDRFYQSDQKNHEVIYGSGVGLEIVNKFVDLHKGIIKVDSIESVADQPGKTRFTIWIPAGRDHLSDAEIIENFTNSEDISLYKRSAQETTTEGDPHDKRNRDTEQVEKPKLLVVEDNAEVRKFIAGLFEYGYDVIQAEDGAQGLECAFEEIPDLVLSDIMMPKLDGLELCKKIKTDPRTSHVPVILLTARTAVTFQIEGIETGADDYITKPFSSEVLQVRVQKLIEQRQALRKLFNKKGGLIPENVSITSVDEKLMKNALDYINEHIADTDLSVEKIARQVGLSRVHFYRKIKALTNMSPQEFIRQIRLEHAAQILRSGKLNVSETRYSVGIQDAEYFRKSFKEQFGQTPRDYAEHHKSSAKAE